MKVRLISLGIVSILITLSCKKPAEDVSPYSFNVNQFATSDAKLLVIVKDENILNSQTNRLVKIKADGAVEQLTLTDASGNNVSERLRPLALSNANPDFMLISFAREGDAPVDGYLIKKATGALSSVGGFGGPPTYNDQPSINLRHPFSYYDGNSYLYFMSGVGIANTRKSIVRLSTVNSNAVSGQKIFSDTISFIDKIAVDAAHNLMFSYHDAGNIQHIVYNENTAAIIPEDISSFWTGSTGNFNFTNKEGYLKEIIYNTGTNTFAFTNAKKLSDYNISTTYFPNDKSYTITYSEKFIMISDGKVYELDNAAHIPKEISGINITNQKDVTHSQSNGLVFVAGENSAGLETIHKINLTNYAVTTYPTPGKYKFYEIEAFEDGTVYATAKRNSDGKNVILKFDANGTETLLDDTINLKGIWLQKVTEFVNQ